MKIAIVDYGSGNLRSVSKAIEKIAPISTQVLVTGDPEEVLKADRVVFPRTGRDARLHEESSHDRYGRSGA